MTKREVGNMKKQAVYMFIVKGMRQNEIANILKVSEKTISLWSKKHKWNDRLTKDVNLEGGLQEVMKRFFDYVFTMKPDTVDSFKTMWYAFLKHEEKLIK